MEGHKFEPFMADGASSLVLWVERLFVGQGRGNAKKKFVRDALKRLAREHDLAFIPNWVETPLENTIIDLLIEAVFALQIGAGRRD